MSKLIVNGCVLLASIALVMAGCGKSGTAGGPSTKTNAASASAGKQDPKITAALAKLPVEDRALAERQQVCPVSGEPLGLMGPPVKVEVKGQPMFICCDGCKDELLAKPDEFLAKIKK